MTSRHLWILLCVCTVACEGDGADDVIDGTGGTAATGGAPTGGTGSGGAATTGGTAGSGGVCDADPDERCSVPIEMCSGGFCEEVCVDYFYCQDDSVYWVSCLGASLYSCPAGCEEKTTPDGRRIYTTTEAEVCNPAGLGGGGAGSSDD